MARATKALLAGFAALVGLWLAAESFQGRRAPAHTATATVPALGLAVTTELFVLSDLTEFERHVTLAAADGAKLRVRMADIRGPADRTGLYRAGGGAEVAVLGAAGDGPSFAVKPLRRLDRPSDPSADWTCLGTFELSLGPADAGDPARGVAQTLAFVPAAGREGGAPAPEGGGGQGCPSPGPPPPQR